MSQIVYQLTPMVIGLLLSPITIAALIIMLMTARAQSNGLAFIAGWFLGIFGVGLVVISFPGLGIGDGAPLIYAGHVKIFIALLLIVWAVYKVSRRYYLPNPQTPRFLQSLDHIKSSRAFGVGLLVSAGNIKNIGFSAAAAVIINQAQIVYPANLLYLTSYTIVGSISVLVPFIIYFLMKHQADPILLIWKTWLIRNQVYVLSGIVVFVAMMLIKSAV